MVLVLCGSSALIKPHDCAEVLGLSPTHARKAASRLVRADILHAPRGAHGGVALSRPADATSPLAIMDACHGLVLATHRAEGEDPAKLRGFHAARPCPFDDVADRVQCRMGEFPLDKKVA